ncbi:hypothetical protein ACHAXN_008778 [Cyclotella atomus]
MPPPRLIPLAMSALLALIASPIAAFTSPLPSTRSTATKSALFALDPVTYLRTEWVSAALCTNQTPRSADKVLQLGTSDGRIVNFVPRTVRNIITSSSEPRDSPEKGGLSISTRRQLKQAAERRSSSFITYSDQPADRLIETQDSSVDVVVMFQSVERMVENGYDWKKAVREAGRVLKPGGRFLFVESAEVYGESFLEEVMSLSEGGIGGDEDLETESEISTGGSTADNLELAENRRNDQRNVIFSEVGFDNVDLVLQPHVAGVAIKAMDADLTMQQRLEKRSQEEEDRLADLSLSAFERGSKKRRRKKVKKGGFGGNDNKEEMGTVS